MSNSPLFTVLTVCTGNICRSPLAEYLLRRDLESSGVVVTSAGTNAVVGESCPIELCEVASAYGVDVSSHRGRPISRDAIGRADLILTASREHRRQVVTMFPRANRNSFTLHEFARLSAELTSIESDPAIHPADAAARMRNAVSLVASRRGQVDLPETPSADDIADPYRLGRDAFARSAQELSAAVHEISRVLRLPPSIAVHPGVD